MKDTTAVPWAVERTSPACVTVTMNVDSAAFEQTFLIRGDAHWDNPDCKRDVEKRHLEWAKERGAGLIDIGDLFCAMQGKYDKRSDKSKLRPEHQDGDYLDRLVSTATDYYAPYAHLFVGIGRGNHETSIRNRHETDLTERLCERLRMTTGHSVPAMGYGGWVRFRFIKSDRTFTHMLHFVHGWGGGGPVTQDMIQMHRLMARTDNADIIAFGHTHDLWSSHYMRHGCTTAGKPYTRGTWGVKCGTYKDEFKDGSGGWHVETGKPPKPIGCIRLDYTFDMTDNRPIPEVRYMT